MNGFFITLEGTEGGGKSTQIERLVQRLQANGNDVVQLREPGGTPISEEIRHLLKHSDANHNMTAEAELLLMCASRAQLVREVIRPAMDAGKIVVCDRFYDSTIAYQGYGRGLDLTMVQTVIDLAVGDIRPNLTLFLHVPVELSESRRASREQNGAVVRDRFEEADREFFQRVENGFEAILAADLDRMVRVDATGSIDEVQGLIWDIVETRMAC